MKLVVPFLFFLVVFQVHGQGQYRVQGQILNGNTLEPIARAKLIVLGSSIHNYTEKDGSFILDVHSKEFQLKIIHLDYEDQIYPIAIKNDFVDIGLLFLFKIIPVIPTHELHSLVHQETNLFGDFIGKNLNGIAYTSKGLQYRPIRINGIHVNDPANRIFNWRDWGNLMSLAAKQKTIRFNTGSQNEGYDLVISPSTTPKGTQAYGSLHNGNYQGLTAMQYASGLQKNGVAINLTMARKWAKEGYVSGSLYDGFNLGLAVEYVINSNQNFRFNFQYSPLRWGQSSTITERTYKALGGKYNPNWGFQNNRKRNANIIKRKMPIFMFMHTLVKRNTKWNTGLLLQLGRHTESKLDFKEADNPFPNYWAKLADISSFPQINWPQLYEINQNQERATTKQLARYAVYEDVLNQKQLNIHSSLSLKLNTRFSWLLEGSYLMNSSVNYATPIDLLGASFYQDIDVFNLIDGLPAKNDLSSSLKGIGDKVNYNYSSRLERAAVSSQLIYAYNNMSFNLSGNLNRHTYQKNGRFKNQRFPLNSFGKSRQLNFLGGVLHSGLNFKLGTVHQLQLDATFQSIAPGFQHSFANIRENNQITPFLKNENTISFKLSYSLKYKLINMLLSAYSLTINDKTHLKSFFAQTGIGTAYFNEVVRNIDHQHMGIEWGLIHQILPNLKASMVVGIGQHFFRNNANIELDYDPINHDQNILSSRDYQNFGETHIKNYRVPSGPQQLYGYALNYYHPKYFWWSINAIHIAANYIDFATHKRTIHFYSNPDSQGIPNEDLNLNQAKIILKQEKLPSETLVNLTLGKSFSIKKRRYAFSFRINNLFNRVYRTSGYEQARLSTYQTLNEDVLLGEQRNFGNKYRYSSGRTFHISLSIKR